MRRIGRQPGVECRAVTGAHPPLRQPLRIGVAGGEGGEPRIEGGGVERAGHDPLGDGAIRLRALRRRLGERHRRLRAPLRCRVARVRSEDGHERQQQRFDDRQPAIVLAAFASAAACFLCSAISLPTSAGDRPSGTAHPWQCRRTRTSSTATHRAGRRSASSPFPTRSQEPSDASLLGRRSWRRGAAVTSGYTAIVSPLEVVILIGIIVLPLLALGGVIRHLERRRRQR